MRRSSSRRRLSCRQRNRLTSQKRPGSYDRSLHVETLEDRRMLSTSITLFKPGMAVDHWISNDAGSSISDSQWTQEGGIRIGDGDISGTSEPVYRFDIPKFTTIESIDIAVFHKEYNSHGGGTDFYTWPGANGSILLAGIFPGPTGGAQHFSTSSTSEVNQWLQGTNDDYLEIRFVNTGWDDIDIRKIEVTIEYADLGLYSSDTSDNVLAGTYKAIDDAYQYCKAYKDAFYGSLDTLAGLNTADFERNYKSVISTIEPMVELIGESVYEIPASAVLPEWLGTAGDAYSTMEAAQESINLWRYVLENEMGEFLALAVVRSDTVGLRDDFLTKLNTAIVDLGELRVDWATAMDDGGIVDSEWTGLTSRLTDAYSSTNEMNSSMNTLASALVNHANNDSLKEDLLQYFSPLANYAVSGNGTRAIVNSPTVLARVHDFLSDVKTNMPNHLLVLEDHSPPNPNPSTWATEPYATSENSIRMVATTASDPSGVKYYFDETSGNPGGSDSGWQNSQSYEDTGLVPGVTYSYKVKTRDRSTNLNAGGYSSSKSATTSDNTPPNPNPSTWSTEPYATGENSISMVATTASDPSGVQYYFDEISGNPGGDDSGWQDSPSYEDTGLVPGTVYTYRAKTRDKSPNQNAGSYSNPTNATTNDNTPPIGSLSVAGAHEFDGDLLTLDSPHIWIDPNATDNSGTVTKMRVSYNGTNWEDWQDYSSAAFEVTLPQTVIDNASGSVSVSMQYRDAAGNPSAIYSDTLDFTTANVVTSTADTIVDDGLTTLREAILAGYLRPAQPVTFDPALYASGPATITLGGTQLELVDRNIQIAGPGADLLTIDADGQSRVFYVEEGVIASISGLTITGGYAQDVDPNDWHDESGGGIYNLGDLTIESTSIENNTADGMGGGIRTGLTEYDQSNVIAIGSLTLLGSTIADNMADRWGGGIYIDGGSMTITNSSY